jgi:hypothetical protein
MKTILSKVSQVQRRQSAPARRLRPRLSDTEKFLATLSLASIVAVTLCVWSANRAEAREWSGERRTLGASAPAVLEYNPIANTNRSVKNNFKSHQY